MNKDHNVKRSDVRPTLLRICRLNVALKSFNVSLRITQLRYQLKHRTLKCSKIHLNCIYRCFEKCPRFKHVPANISRTQKSNEKEKQGKRKRVKTSLCSMSSVTWQKALDLYTTARPSSRINRKIWQIFQIKRSSKIQIVGSNGIKTNNSCNCHRKIFLKQPQGPRKTDEKRRVEREENEERGNVWSAERMEKGKRKQVIVLPHRNREKGQQVWRFCKEVLLV